MFPNFFQFLFESLNVILINMITILMMPAKLATLGLLKIKVFWNKDYDIIIFVHDVTNKILSGDSNYLVHCTLTLAFQLEKIIAT